MNVRDQSNKPKLTFYHKRKTTLFALRSDPRFSYCMYVPEGYEEESEKQYPMLVAVHGSARDATTYRSEFMDFCEENECIILAPLFPSSIDKPSELHNYKYLEYRGVRFDQVLLAMIDEMSAVYRVDAARVMLTGFSGGGHFAHRFYYVHPDRLFALSICAPGVVTLLDEDRPWPAGVGGLEANFGVPARLDLMKPVKVQMVVGGNDVETWEINTQPGKPHWIAGVNDIGVNRQTRLLALKKSFEAHGIPVRHDVVPGVAHEGYKLLDPVRSFFADVLAEHRRSTPAGVPT